MLKSILLASALVIGFTAPTFANSICGDDGNSYRIEKWCDSSDKSTRNGNNGG